MNNNPKSKNMMTEKISIWLRQLPNPVAKQICFELVTFGSLFDLLNLDHNPTIDEKVNMIHDLLNDTKLSQKDKTSRLLVFYAGIDIIISSEEISFIENIEKYEIPLPIERALPDLENFTQKMSELKSGWELTFQSWKNFKKSELSKTNLIDSIDC
jgi:hypothetical protein